MIFHLTKEYKNYKDYLSHYAKSYFKYSSFKMKLQDEKQFSLANYKNRPNIQPLINIVIFYTKKDIALSSTSQKR